jgi:hypothetical protein
MLWKLPIQVCGGKFSAFGLHGHQYLSVRYSNISWNESHSARGYFVTIGVVDAMLTLDIIWMD